MSNMKVTEKQAMEILKKLDTLIEASVELEADITESDDIDSVLLCLEDTIDEFCETVELIEDIRAFLLELKQMDEDEPEETAPECDDSSPCCAPPDLREDLIRIAEMVKAFERMSAEKRRKESLGQDLNLPDEESVAMLFYEADDHRLFPFEHVLRICPWLNEHSVMRAIPGSKDLYYLYEEGSESKTESGIFLTGPVVVIKLNDDHFLVTPDVQRR